jgi:hypothetical protein
VEGEGKGKGKRGGLRSFALGSVVGASAVLAAMGRRRRATRRGGRARGLAAFESAPCYLERIEQERGGERPRRGES